MRTESVLNLRQGQVFTIPGHESEFRCTRVEPFGAGVERLSDHTFWFVDFETFVEIKETAREELLPILPAAAPAAVPEPVVAPEAQPPIAA